MDGRAFLDIAKELSQGATEGHWRTAAGRAYYALFLEGRTALARWGFQVPPPPGVHSWVRLRFVYAPDPDLKEFGNALERLGRLRNEADYALSVPGPFASPARVKRAVKDVEQNLNRLDQVEADRARLSAVIAGIRKAWP